MKKSFLLKFLTILAVITATLFIGTACKNGGGDENPLTGSVKYKIEFYVDGEKVHTVDTADGNFSMPENPQKEGYVFEGWYLDDKVWEKVFKKDEIKLSAISSKLKLFAKFSGHKHVYVGTITPVTCMVNGFTTYVCDCGDTYTSDEVLAKGSHTFQDVIVVAPTCDERGYDLKVCADCGTQIKENYVDVLSHDFKHYVSNGDATFDKDGTKTAVCERDNCNEKDSITDEGSMLTGGITFKTLTVDGLNVSGEVLGEVEEFDFNNELNVPNGIEFVVSLNANGTGASLTGAMELNHGNNVFYLSEYVGGELSKTYVVTIYRQQKYLVSFNTNGGSEIESQYVIEGGLVEQPSQTPTKTGYSFGGWNYNFNNAVTENITIDAIWNANEFTVTFDAGENGTVVGSTTQTISAVGYTLPSVTVNAGSSFMGWKYNGEYITSDFVFTEDCTLVADYVVTAYTVTYVYTGKLMRNGKELKLSNDSELLIKSGYVLPTVENDEGAFGGWMVEGTNDVFDGSKDLTSNITLVAITKHTLSFVYNGQNLIDAIEIDVGVTYDENVTGLKDAINKIDVATGYHLALFIGENEFTSITFDNANDTESVVVEVKEVKNEATVKIIVWGPENDVSVGTVNGGYSTTLNVKHGEEISVTLEGVNDYEFVHFADTNWNPNVSNAPSKSAYINDGVITVENHGEEITLYAFFYNYIIR